MSRRGRAWIAGWIAAVGLLELVTFAAGRSEPALTIAGFIQDAYVGEPIRLATLRVTNHGDRPIRVRTATLGWLGANAVAQIDRTIAVGETAMLEDAVAPALERPAGPGSYPITIAAVDATMAADGAEVRPTLPSLPLTTTIEVMPDGGDGDGLNALLAAGRRCGPAPKVNAGLAAVPHEEREAIRAALRDASECLSLARAAAHATRFTAPQPRRYSFPHPTYQRWLDVGRWLLLAGAEAEWRGDLESAWSTYLDGLLLGLRLQAATWRHDTIENLFAARLIGGPRRELVRLQAAGPLPTSVAAVVRAYIGSIEPLLGELERSIGPEAFRVDQPDDVTHLLRYSPLAPFFAPVIRSMALANQRSLVEKRFAHLVRTKALVRRLEHAISSSEGT